MKRNMSVLISIILKHFKISNKDIDRILNLCDLLTFETAHFWTKQYSDGDYSGLDLEGRRNGRTDLFYDTFPDIENSARIWSIVQSKDRSAKFSPYDLALYISKVYEEETNSELTDGKLIRSESSCRRDLLRWGFYLGKNKNRPYYLGHEREDVVIHRNEFTKYFVERKHLYWTLTDTEDKENCEWTMPMRQENGDKKVALFCHDEVNNRRGEVSEKKWFYPGEEPFFQKGRMQSIMQSWFILAHPSGPYFQLSDEEFKLACKSYSELEEPDELYYPREASAQIILDGKNYFDSEIFLQQMERLFKLIQFSKALKNHSIEILVDNATTHTAKPFSLTDFRKGTGYDCPVDSIDWVDEKNNKKTLNCYYENEDGEKISKGLFIIAQDLGLIRRRCLPKEYKLEQLRAMLKEHPAFKEETKLEELSKKYPITIKLP